VTDARYRRTGVILVLVSAAAFGTMAVCARNAYAAGHDVPSLLFLRFALASAVLWPLMLTTRTVLPPDKELRTLFVMGAILYFGQSYTYFTAVEMIPAALASLLLYLYPVAVAILSYFFLRERFSRVKVLALALALLGTALTIGPVGGGRAVGIAMGVASAVIYAGYIVVGAKALGSVSPLAATTGVATSAGLIYGIILVVRQRPIPMSAEAWLWAALLALATLIAIGTFLAGLQRVGPVNASTLSSLEPLVTALLGWIYLSESLVPLQMIGGLLILFAITALARAPAFEPHG